MNTTAGQLDLLKSAVVLAVADGVVSASEKGLINGLAARIGVGEASLAAMIERARTDPGVHDELFARTLSDPELALELLVAAARLDGEIHDREREILVNMLDKLKISAERFGEIYQRGIERADALRRSKLG